MYQIVLASDSPQLVQPKNIRIDCIYNNEILPEGRQTFFDALATHTYTHAHTYKKRHSIWRSLAKYQDGFTIKFTLNNTAVANP